MNTGFDIRPLQLSSKVMGIGVYIKRLIENISTLDRVNKYFLIHLKGREMPPLNLAPGFRFEFLDIPPAPEDHTGILWDLLFLKKELAPFNLDVVHFTNPLEFKLNFELGRDNFRRIMTLYDLTPLFFPEKLFTGKRRILKPIYNSLLSGFGRGGEIISISQNTSRDIIEKLSVPSDSVNTIYLGVDSRFRPLSSEETLEKVHRKYGLPHRFILYLGGFAPHKNLDTLLKALQEVQEIPLVIAGKCDPFFFRNIKERIGSLNVESRVFFPNFIDSADLPALYNLAEVFVFPSLYEGFGLPLLEAMACGTPSIASRASSLPEIAGDGALLFDPSDSAELAEKIKSILSDRDMAQDLSNRALKQAEKFSWKKCAEETLAVYEKSYRIRKGL